MELQELKNRWEALDKKMEQNISLNRTLLERQLSSKAQTHVQRLVRFNIGMMIFSIAMGIFCFIFHSYTAYPMILTVAGGATVINLIWCGLFLFKLDKLDEIDSTNYTKLKRATEFELLYKYSMYMGYVLTALLLIFCFYYIRSSHIMMVFATVICILAVFVGVMIDRSVYRDVKQLRATLKEIDSM